MIKFKASDRFDLNKIGLWLTGMIALLMLFYPFKLSHLLMLELLLFAYGYYLFNSIQKNKNIAILINKQDKWFVENKGEMYPIQLKDYWLLKKHLFLWATGSKYSVSFVVTRSIIGAKKFSQLRYLIK